MDVYIPLYIMLLCLGAVAQGAYALLRVRATHISFTLAAAGAGMVLVSAWLERDILLGCGQLFLLCILWRLGAKDTGEGA